MKQNEKFNDLQDQDLENINGGIAPGVIIAAKLVGAFAGGVGSGIAGGYTYKKVSNWLKK